MREAIEETGFPITLRAQEIGKIVEWRAQPMNWCFGKKLKQISYCGIGNITGKIEKIELTPDEIGVGLTLMWVTLAHAIDLMLADNPDDYEGKFIRARDLIFLKEAVLMERKG